MYLPLSELLGEEACPYSNVLCLPSWDWGHSWPQTQVFGFSWYAFWCIHLCSVACLEVSIYVTDFISHLSKLYSLTDPQKKEGELLACHSLVTGASG